VDSTESTSPFDLAIAAFDIRFERELTSCWESVVAATIQPLIAAAPEEKQGVLRKCFSDAAEKIAAVVQSYFPKLLRTATKQWTAAHIREQTCDFLGMDADENWKDTATPRADSRVIKAANEILYRAQCLPENSSDGFLLPWWADRAHLEGYWCVVRALFPNNAFTPRSGDDRECMSHADSLSWVTECEIEIRKRLKRQIENEILDAMITDGATGGSVETSGSPLLRRYRSEIKRAVLIELSRNPYATDLEVCRALDANGAVELPEGWKRKPEDRLFEAAYRDSRRRNKIESLISKVRADLSSKGLL